MLGNWSLGDYFKKDQLAWFLEFLTVELKLPQEKLWVSVFEGTNQVPKDTESSAVWTKLGIPKDRIHYYGVKKNWWSMTGSPEEMSYGDVGGPDSEVFFEFDKVKHDPKFGKKCHPNCECGRFLEIGNSVFIQYVKIEDGSLEELPQKNVDFGGGLERLTAAANNTPDIFKIDSLQAIIVDLEKQVGADFVYGKDTKKDVSARIIADHLRASTMLISSGVVPSNKEQGYVLRKFIRRALFHMSVLTNKINENTLPVLTDQSKFDYPLKVYAADRITKVINDEAGKFAKALSKGMRKLEKVIKRKARIDGKLAFDLYQTDGFPLELTLEILENEGGTFSAKDKNTFEKEFKKHKELSRSASAGMFKGGLADSGEETVKLHTLTHLLHWALRKVIGKSVKQEGSNITKDRLRFDFSHDKKLTGSQIIEIQNLVNGAIDKGLAVTKTIEEKQKALESGALAFFKENYPEKVSVYTIGKSDNDWISKEFCGGPHVDNTRKLGRANISKQKKIGSNIIRIYAQLASQ